MYLPSTMLPLSYVLVTILKFEEKAILHTTMMEAIVLCVRSIIYCN